MEDTLLKVIGIYGPMGIVAIALAWAIRKYVPELIDSHMKFVSVCSETITKQEHTLSRLADTIEYKDTEHSKTHRGLVHGAEALQALAEALNHGPRTAPHTAAIKEAVAENRSQKVG